MTGPDLVVLGTASQAPTRTRNHNGYLLRWGQDAILFDPGEGTQRQLTLSGASPHRLDRICLTHLHGDHCLGLPGILERIAMDGACPEIPIHFPASGRPYVERLCDAAIGRRQPVRLEPLDDGEGGVIGAPPLRLTALPLRHPVPALGWRIEEPPRRHVLPERLQEWGLHGPDVGRLISEGHVDVAGSRVMLEEVSEWGPGRSFAMVMDTAVCDNAIALAAGVDLLLCEATFLESESPLAREHGHLTARSAATIAREAGVGRLVLSHFSARYESLEGHLREATEIFDDVVVPEDLDRVDFPPSRWRPSSTLSSYPGSSQWPVTLNGDTVGGTLRAP